MKVRQVTPLNVTAEEFCNALGLPRRADLMMQLRDLKLVKFLEIGNKHLYPRTYIQNMLLEGKIQIRTDKGEYYVTMK